MRIIKITIATLLLSGIALVGKAQNTEGVKIGNDVSPPDASAMLEVESSNKGVLFPRVDIPDLSLSAPVLTPANGLLVFNTNTTTGEGFYYWNGSLWVKVGSVGSSIPRISYVSMRGMEANLDDNDLGMLVYVTTPRVADLGQTLPGGGNAFVETFGLWFLGYREHCENNNTYYGRQFLKVNGNVVETNGYSATQCVVGP